MNPSDIAPPDTVAALLRIHAAKCDSEIALFDELVNHFAAGDAPAALDALLNWADCQDIIGVETPPEQWEAIGKAKSAYPQGGRS